MRVAGYIRVSSREQGDSGLSLAAQKGALSAAAALREGWTLAHIAVEVASAGNTRKRPVLRNLLDDLDAGRYDALLVSRLDRLARSVGDFAAMLDRADRHGWTLVCLSPAVDMTEPYGKAMAGVAAVFAQLERELIAQRTREGLEIARARGTFKPGEHLRYSDPAGIARMRALRREGLSYDKVAAAMTAEGWPTRHGGAWAGRTIYDVLRREDHGIQRSASRREKGNTR